jgi:hypothetical protein
MNWRRGLLLAGIHLAVAGSLIFWQDANDWHSLSVHPVRPFVGTRITEPIPNGNGMMIEFDPCKLHWRSTSFRESVVLLANLPVSPLLGWKVTCPKKWTLAGAVESRSGGRSRSTEIVVSIGFCAMIALLWFIVGSFPLSPQVEWWWEPGAFITICTLIAFGLVVIPATQDLSCYLMVFAALAWLFWFCLLVWKWLSLSWQLAARRVTHGTWSRFLT